MTRRQAQKEAERRWGENAEIKSRVIGRKWTYHIFFGPGWAKPEIGSGATWEEAFADADRREGKNA